MKKTNLLAVLGMAAVLTVGMSFGAMAEETTPVLSKEIVTDGKTYLPNTEFDFKIAAGEAGSLNAKVNDDTTDTTLSVKEGITAAIKDTSPKVTFTSDMNTKDGKLLAGDHFTQPVSLEFDASKFTGAGIYHYTIAEQPGTYTGMTYDTSTKDIYVFVANGTDAGTYTIQAINVYDRNETPSKINKITNDFTKDDNVDSVHDATFTKTVAGNSGDKTHDFNFTVTVANTKDGNRPHKLVVTKATGSVEYKLTSGEAGQKFQLKNGETAVVTGLNADDNVTFSESAEEVGADGYVTNATGDKGLEKTAAGTVAGVVTADGAKGTITNTRDITTPTGVVMNVAPYILMVVAALGLGGMFLTKKKHED